MNPIPSSSTNDSEPLTQYRNATNFKTIQRNDPSVVEIIETSTYSVIYHYDEVSSKWAKQKQEGSLFIVRRDKSPEHALFMLNRQTVKNVTIPLIPGEMKVTIVDEAMIQVARRKQKPHIGIWFSESGEAVGRFKSAILRICGEPSAPGSKGTPASAPTTVSPPIQPQAADDGFSRLFAGLMQPTAAPPSPPAPQTITQTDNLRSTYNPAEPRPLLYDHRELSSQTPPPTLSTIPQESVHPPGQTVDDLLMSILGPAVSKAPPKPVSPLQTETQPNLWQSPALPHPALRTKVGDATFAQAAKSPPPPPQPPIHMVDGPSFLHHPGDDPMTQGRDLPPHLIQYQQASRGATRDSVLDGISGRPLHVNGTVDESQRKVDFVNNLLRLVHTDPGFVEELWAGYLARMDGMRGHPG